MKTTICALVLAFGMVSCHEARCEGAPEPVSADKAADEAKRADIRKLLVATGSGELGKVVLQNLMAQFKKSMPNVPEQFWADFMKEVDVKELMELCVPAFEKNVSHEDIKATLAYYESPAGKRYVAAQSRIVQENMKAGQEWGQAIAKRVLAKMEAEGIKK